MDQQGPSHGVPDQLLPHVHLISTHRYASHPRLDFHKVTEWLLAAPKIARDTAPFFWTYLDTPSDGQIFLTWQSLARLGTDFASDGYIWSGPEVVYTQDVGNGLILEIYLQKAGFKPMVEPLTLHSRRRFRLTPAKAPTPNMQAAQCDPSLWIVQYGPSEAHERVPSNSVPIDPRINNVMAFRMQLQRAGHIVRKEFMLADRGNWPQIPLPRLFATPHGPRPPVPQSMAYPPNAAGPPPKRGSRGAQHIQQHQQPHHPLQPMPVHPMAGAVGPLLDYEDDEDTSRGDIFDHMSPRDVSLARYEQNHDWMEELLNSPYRIGQISMPDLGFGLKGELAPLTAGIFEAQGSQALAEIPKKPYVGTLGKGLADEFRKRVAAQIEATTAEIKRLEAEHAKAMADVKAGRQLTHAERELRAAVSETGPEFWRLEGRTDVSDESSRGGEGGHWPSRHGPDMDEIVAGIEEALGRKAQVIQDVNRVHDGGYQELVIEPPKVEPVPQPPQPADAASNAPPAFSGMSRHPSQAGSQASGLMVGDSDVDMGGTAAGLLDQMHGGFSSTSTPINNFSTPQPHLSAIPSTAATPANATAPSPQPPMQPAGGSADVEMGDTAAPEVAQALTPATIPDQGTGSGEWVVIPKSAVNLAPSPIATAPATAPAYAIGSTAPGSLPTTSEVAAPSPSFLDSAKQQQAVEMSGASAAAALSTPAAGSAPLTSSSKPASAAAMTPGDFSSLGDIEGAGDALAGFGDTPVTGAGEDGLDINMDMVEDSAFGDAFHGVSELRDDAAGGGVGAEGVDASAGGGGATPAGDGL